ncbi:hypothetical protein [Shewanella baltica]|uniref:hypothetical protein n=1 Tax=Shewanella TaxID=22 RepID=UPI003D7AC60D
MTINYEYIRVTLNGTKAEFDKLENDCKDVSIKVDSHIRNEHQRANRSYEPLNPITVYAHSYQSSGTGSYTDIILEVNSTIKVCEITMKELESMGYIVERVNRNG